MVLLLILTLIVFSTLLCIVEIPKMRKDGLYRELWAFSIMLGCGILLAILKILNMDIPNPADWVAVIYSPVTELLKSVFE